MIQLLPVMPQDVASTETELIPALSGKPVIAHDLLDIVGGNIESKDESLELGDVIDFLEELTDMLEQAEQPEGPEEPELPLLPATAPQSSQPQTVQQQAKAPAREVPSTAEPLFAERWLHGMQSQQELARQGQDRAQERQELDRLAVASARPKVDSRPSASTMAVEAASLERSAVVDNKGLPFSLSQAGSATPSASTNGSSAELAWPISFSSPQPAVAEQQIVSSAAELEIALTQTKPIRPAGSDSGVITTGHLAPTSATQTGKALIRLQAPEAKWGEQMLQALRQHVEVSLQQGLQQAHIRLDPPELGSLDIHLSHESGRLSVQIGSGQADIIRLLQQTSERLRQELMEHNFPQVDVHVFADSGQQQNRHRQQAHPLDKDLRQTAQQVESKQRHSTASGDSSDVLVTV